MNDPLKRLSWDDFRVVKSIGETGSLASAAEVIGINQSTVFRRLAQIEDTLGVLLFERRRTGYVTTPVGSEVIALAQRLELDIVAVTSRLAGLDQEPAGDVRVASSDTLALHLLTPILRRFKALHPAIRIELVISNGSLNLARGETDIALRATNRPPENLVGRKIAYIAWAPYGRAVDYPDGPPDPADLYDRAWASYCGELATLAAVQHLDARASPTSICYRVNTVEGLTAAVRAGLGAGYMPCLVGDVLPGLTRLGPAVPELSDDLWLLTHPDLRKSRRVDSLLEYCARTLGRQRALIEGRGGAALAS